MHNQYFDGYSMQCIDGLKYKMKEHFDFGFISRYGKVFKVFDDQDSGNICFGTEKDGEKFFVKFAGTPTEACTGTAEAATLIFSESSPVSMIWGECGAAPFFRLPRNISLVQRLMR